MNQAFTILFSQYSHLFSDDPVFFPSNDRGMGRVRHAFDRLSDPVVWWLWIHHFFIPNVVGLPSDLETRFYKILLQNYFSMWSSTWEQELAWWKRQRCVYMRIIGSVLHKGACSDQMAADILSYLSDFFMSTLKGRAFFLEMVDEWDQSLDDNVTMSNALCTVRNFIKYSFLVYDKIYIRSGFNGRVVENHERVELTWLYDKWRVNKI
jgi:hypothetical protein